MLKAFETLLVGLGYKISESTVNTLIAYHLTNQLVISITGKNKIIIAKSNNSDIRFNGIIDNAIQLKLILNCIIRNL